MKQGEGLDDDDRREVLWRTYVAVQREQQALGTLPAAAGRTVLSRFGWVLAWLGAIQLGVLVSCFSVFIVFVVTRMVFHIDLTRFFLR